MTRCADLPRAAAMAYRVLAEQNVSALPVDPLALLRKCRGTEVCTYADAAARLGMTDAAFERACGVAEAFTLAQGDCFMICYRAEGNPARQRFTLAHELGHRVLGHTARDPAGEREADTFASHLLCPRPVLQALRFAGADESEMARVFYVTRRCIQEILRQPETEIPVDLLDKVGGMMLSRI